MFKLIRQGFGPILKPHISFPWEKDGVFNPGITKIGDDIYLLYRTANEKEVNISRFGLAKSQDGLNFERLSKEPIFESKENFDKWENEDSRITKIGEDFYITHDLENGAKHPLLIHSSQLNDVKIGPGLSPIKTSDGWLLIYQHTRREELTNRLIYSIRAALLDLNDPTKLISKLDYDILIPERPYETEKEIGIIFPTGGFVHDDTLYVYYSASDRYVCLATGSLSDLLSELKQPFSSNSDHC
ncbi:MAG: hypothetical protein WAW11_05110 [Patescibacteria group bacterium]